MMDYLYTRDDGGVVAIANMSNADLLGCFSWGIEVHTGYDHNTIMERLRIELVVRRIEGRL